MIVLGIIVIASLAAALADVFCFGASVLGGLGCFVLSYIIGHLIFAVFVLIVGAPVKKDKPIEQQKKIYPWLVWQIGWGLCFYTGVRVRVENKDIIPKEGRFVFVSNHRSAFDPLAVLATLPELNLAFICKPSLFKYPVINTIGTGAGFLPIDRDNDRNALRAILTAADYLKRDFCSIGIYPEGTRTKEADGTMLPFHAGSFKIAQRANVPIVIFSTHGTEKLAANFPLRRTSVTLRALDVIPAEKVKSMTTAELADYSAQLIQADVYQENAAKATRSGSVRG